MSEEIRIDIRRGISMGRDFERLWLEKLRGRLEVELGPEAAGRVLEGSGGLCDDSPAGARDGWTREMLGRLRKEAGEEAAERILLGCACLPPTSKLDEAREAYAETGSIESARRVLERDFLAFLTEVAGIAAEDARSLVAGGWGMAGVLRDGRIVATKIPRSGSLAEYLAETDPDRRRSLYCHCPRVRHLVGTGGEPDSIYCYCGGGFYRFIWEYVLDGPVEVELLQSVMEGDDVCSFAVIPVAEGPTV